MAQNYVNITNNLLVHRIPIRLETNIFSNKYIFICRNNLWRCVVSDGAVTVGATKANPDRHPAHQRREQVFVKAMVFFSLYRQ